MLELSNEGLLNEMQNYTRATIIEWLPWNYPNSIYSDEISLKEFGNVMTRNEGVEIMIRHFKRTVCIFALPHASALFAPTFATFGLK